MNICPLMNKEIDDGMCFDISMVSEELAPERTMPDEVASIECHREICLTCEYHRND